jgi:isopenicillin N synthase-like dioxygenase
MSRSSSATYKIMDTELTEIKSETQPTFQSEKLLRVPTLDIRDFTSTSPQLKARFVSDLERAYQDTGFVIITGHAISETQQANAYKVIDEFFKLPTEVKRQYEVSGIGGARGYTSFGKEHAKDSNVGDLKEFFHVGMELPPGHALEFEYLKTCRYPLCRALMKASKRFIPTCCI